MKIKNLNPQFPRIYRRITEWTLFNKTNLKKTYAYTSILLTFFVVLLLFVLVGFLVIKFVGNYNKHLDLKSQRGNLYSKINFWNSISEKYPGYAEAYFNIAVLYYQLNDLKNARTYLSKTLIFDPNYSYAPLLSEELVKRGY